MRQDALGLFWQDTVRAKVAPPRAHPVIPETGWKAPTEFPRLADAPVIAFDVETYDPDLLSHGPGWARGRGHLVGVSIAVPGKAWYWPLRHTVCAEQNADPAPVLAWLRDTLSTNTPKVGANLLYDVGWLAEEGVHVKGMLYDVQFAEALLDETARTNLGALGQKYLNEGKESNQLYEWSQGAYGGKVSGKQRANIYRCPPCLVGPYAEADAELPLRVIDYQWAALAGEGLLELFDMECRLIPLLVAMRRAGVSVDVRRAEEVSAALKIEEDALNQQLTDMAGFLVNADANASVCQAFEKLKILVPRSADDKPTFTKETLSATDHPFADLVLETRKVSKIRSAFIESSILQANISGKVFCEFHPLRGESGGTRSGRFSCKSPNLQQVPARDEKLAPLVRGCFIPDAGHTRWKKFDYSQIEYRCLAHFARGYGSDELRAQYNTDPNTDYHIHTQQLVAKLTGQEIARKPIKNINFGLIYGMGQGKLVRMLGLERAAGETLFTAYHEAAPFAKATMEFYADQARRSGYVQTILGRRSRFDLWEPEYQEHRKRLPALPYQHAYQLYSGRIKRAYTHKSLNRVLQGSAADMMKRAMLTLWDSGVLDVVGVPRLTVHDELDFSDAGGNDDAWAFVKRTLETAIPLLVPVVADLEMGPNWGATE